MWSERRYFELEEMKMLGEKSCWGTVWNTEDIRLLRTEEDGFSGLCLLPPAIFTISLPLFHASSGIFSHLGFSSQNDSSNCRIQFPILSIQEWVMQSRHLFLTSMEWGSRTFNWKISEWVRPGKGTGKVIEEMSWVTGMGQRPGSRVIREWDSPGGRLIYWEKKKENRETKTKTN